MKSKRIQALAAGSLVAALLALGCSRNTGTATAGGPTPTPVAGAVAVTVPAPVVTVSAGTVPAAQASWSEMEVLTFDQRSQFVTELAGLVGLLDSQIGALNAKRATMTTDTKDWDIAMMDVTAARAYLAGLSGEVSHASPDTWDQEKERVGTAWQKAEDACDKVRTTTTS